MKRITEKLTKEARFLEIFYRNKANTISLCIQTISKLFLKGQEPREVTCTVAFFNPRRKGWLKVTHKAYCEVKVDGSDYGITSRTINFMQNHKLLNKTFWVKVEKSA